ncbi:MAG: hypothetical protein KGL39_32085 [Patescibacteria group bacterium]|nr:hypothetical protein [Patescibacteria group bacterium]
MKLAGRLFGAALAALVASGSAYAAQSQDGRSIPERLDDSGVLHVPGYCQITVPAAAASVATLLGTGTGATCTPPNWATWAQFLPESTTAIAVRCAADGTTVSSTLGMPVWGNVKNYEPAIVSGHTAFYGWSCVSATGGNVTMDIWWMQ